MSSDVYLWTPMKVNDITSKQTERVLRQHNINEKVHDYKEQENHVGGDAGRERELEREKTKLYANNSKQLE